MVRAHSKLSGMISASLMVGALLMASCSSTPSTPGATGTATVSKPTGSLVLAINMESGSMISPTDPYLGQGGTFQALTTAIFDSLIDLTLDGQPRAALAEKWEISADGKSHTFFIRKGVKFQDGSDLTGADVKFSLDSFIKLGTGTYVQPWKAAIDSVELKDSYTVVVHMKDPQFQLLNGSETLEGELAVLPKKYIEDKGWEYFDKNPMGSGPWKFVSLETNAKLVLEAMDTHWRTVPKFKSVTLMRVAEEGTKVAMLKTGEADIAEISPDSVAGIKAAGLKILGHYGSAQWYMVPFWDVTQPEKYALGDVRVRKGLSLAVDRKEMADKLYGGYAQPSAIFYAPKTAYFFDPNVLKPDPLDVEQSKQLLSQAGYPNGFSTKIWDAQGGAGVASQGNTALAGYWKKIGVNADLTPIDYPSMLKKFIPKQLPEVWNSLFAWASSGGNLQFEKMNTAYHTTKGVFGNQTNTRLSDLIDQVPQTADPVKKKALALEAATLAKTGYSVIPLLDVDSIFAYGAKIGNFQAIKGLRGLGAVLELITHSK